MDEFARIGGDVLDEQRFVADNGSIFVDGVVSYPQDRERLRVGGRLDIIHFRHFILLFHFEISNSNLRADSVLHCSSWARNLSEILRICLAVSLYRFR